MSSKSVMLPLAKSEFGQKCPQKALRSLWKKINLAKNVLKKRNTLFVGLRIFSKIPKN